MHFGSVSLPAAGVDGLAVSPEDCNQGFGTHLLRAAERQAARDGAMLAMLRTNMPRFFGRRGWATVAGNSWRRVDARALLARLLDSGFLARPRRRLHIRPWLMWDQAALARIFRQNVSADENSSRTDIRSSRRTDILVCQMKTGRNACPPEKNRDSLDFVPAGYGPLERTTAYWRWLLSRHGYSAIYVALEGPDQLELGEISTRAVGYAVIRGEQIVELMTAPDHPEAATKLLARCAGDAIEQGRHSLVLHAPTNSPLLDILDQSGGYGPAAEGQQGAVCMMRLLDPLEFMRRLRGQFHERAAAACLPRPLDLGLLVDGDKYQLKLRADSVQATSERVGRSYLRLCSADFCRLLLGELDVEAMIAKGRLDCSTTLAHQAALALFPRLPLWRPLWDDLPALAD